METMCRLSQTWGVLIGRICLALVFLQSGYDKVFNIGRTAKLMAAKGMPMADLLVYPATAIVLVGGVLLLIGWQARWAALALIVFMVIATFYFHDFWNVPKEQFINQFHHFFKNLGLIGALFMVMGMGSGPMSLEKHGR